MHNIAFIYFYKCVKNNFYLLRSLPVRCCKQYNHSFDIPTLQLITVCIVYVNITILNFKYLL